MLLVVADDDITFELIVFTTNGAVGKLDVVDGILLFDIILA
jgi:hypothetical protein